VLRLNTMGEMAAGIAHELNQPLSAIANFARGTVRRLSQGIGDESELIDVAKSIADESVRASEIIRSLNRYVKKCELQRAELDVNDVVRGALHIVSGEAHQRGVTVTLRCAEGLSKVNGDLVQLKQVLVNLLCNGFDALDDVPSPKTLTVETRPLALGGIEVSVADNGCGLPIGASIFDAFTTTKSHGLGMGLTISRSIVEAHHGRLWAEPNAHGGAIFRFTMPLEREPRDDD
jgi:C4-dicarboxylate-specific signal transduction histidine kinase